jgi:hypothetical protein
LGTKITPAEAQIKFLQHHCNGRQRRYTIGRHGSPWTVDEARAEALRRPQQSSSRQRSRRVRNGFGPALAVLEIHPVEFAPQSI